MEIELILIDSNIILDVINKDKNWYNWSSSMLKEYGHTKDLAINPIIYTEIAYSFKTIENVEQHLSYLVKLDIPYEAAFLAAVAFRKYREENKGKKPTILPDFIIGAHAVTLGIPLLTRDQKRYKTYFPELQLITP